MVDQIDIEKLPPGEAAGGPEEAAGDAAGGSALPGLVRELIRTPAFKELLLIHLRQVEPANAREVVKAAIWEDVAFSMGVVGATPGLVNSLAEALLELGAQLGNFTGDILREFLVKLGQDLDTEAIKSIPAAYAPVVNELLLEDREALDALIAGLGALADEALRAAERTWRKVWNTADFGKIRVGLSAHFEERRLELEGRPEIFNPVAISNLMGVVAPLANFLLRAFTRTVQALDLPSEILANAVFQLLEDIDQRELGGLVNAVSHFINVLHQGNLVLGRDEPRFKEVASRFSRGLVENVDGEQLKAAALALGEDGKVIGEVVSGYLFATPESTVALVKAVHTALNAVLRTAAETARRLGELPDAALAELAEDYEKRFEARELGRILNNSMEMFARLSRHNPDMLSRILVKTFSSLDPQVWAEASRAAVLQVKDAVMEAPQVSAALQPEAIGRDINAGLAAFNRFSSRNPHLVAEKVSETLAAVDAAELKKAVQGLAAPLSKALVSNAEVLMAVVVPVAVGVLKATPGMAASLVRKRLPRARRRRGD
jgi:hypothetical protein